MYFMFGKCVRRQCRVSIHFFPKCSITTPFPPKGAVVLKAKDPSIPSVHVLIILLLPSWTLPGAQPTCPTGVIILYIA
jgi:hypothetical protein